MRKIKMLAAGLVAVTLTTFGASAQNLNITRVGDVVRPDGTRAYVVPATTAVIDITVEKESVVTGPYARFAQKYFGVIAPLADKETYRIISADINYYDPDNMRDFTPQALPAAEMTAVSHIGAYDEFPRVLPDRLTSASRNTEDAAAAAAQNIFSLRKRRAELITGDYAETVYGAGLEAAIDRMDRMENEYLELFFGKQMRTTYTVRYYVTPAEGSANTTVCRFRDDAGLLPESDLSGEPIVLECRPEGVASAVYPPERKRNPKSTEAEYAVADLVTCRIMEGRNELGRTVIPMYQYGVRTILPIH